MNDQQIHDRRWVILGVLVTSLLVVILDNTILNVALPSIQRELGATQSEQEWAINSYSLVFAGLLFTYGVMGDRYGRKRVLSIGMALFGVASAISAFSQSPEMLIAARALMGIGAAGVMPSTLSIIQNVFEPHERGKAIGIWAGFSGLAIAIGPITGGALLEHFWWGSVFLINVPFVAAALIAIAVLVPESKDPNPQPIQPGAVLLSIAGLVLFVYGIIQGGERNDWAHLLVWGPIVAGLVLLGLFAWTQSRSRYPVLDITLFRNPRFSAATAAIALVFFALFGTIFFLTYYLQFARGYSPLESGLLFLPVAVALAFFSPRSVGMVHRFGAKAVCTTGLLLVTVAFSGYHFVELDTPIWIVEVLLFLQGAGMANTMAPATESIMSTLPRERAGAGSAVNNTMRQVGGALGVAVLGTILASTYRSEIEPALAALPEAVRQEAGSSIGATLAAARGDATLVTAAEDAFVSAMHATSIGSALVALLGAAIVLRWLPGKHDVRPHAGGDTSPVGEPTQVG